MTTWRPHCGAEVIQRRNELLDRARAFFASRNLMSVDTPALGATGVSDPHIESMRTASGAYLQTSPEYYMKRLLASGYPDIYSINRVFRDGERGRHHLSEFTMIEWYRRDLALSEIIAETAEFIAFVLDEPRLDRGFARCDYSALMQDRCGIDPFTATAEELAAASSADGSLVANWGADRDTWLDYLLATVVVPTLPAGQLTVIAHFPASQAALARLCPDDSRAADRFEVYFGPVELANGYVELTDPGELACRMHADNDRRRRDGKRPVDPDDKLLAALAHGMPACAGVALGFERLHMIAANASEIRNVVCFSDLE